MCPTPEARRICFVSGTRAEFGLMRSTLQAINSNPALSLQLIVTGIHLDRSRGGSIAAIRDDGWKIDAKLPWKTDGSQTGNAISTGTAIAKLAKEFRRLKTEIILVTGDRVEAFAAASAAHISGLLVAHVHGGDRAMGLVDDSLRHAITKLSHVHFPATTRSAERIARLGEQSWRIFPVGTPGLDGIKDLAASRDKSPREFPDIHPHRFAFLLLHPQTHFTDKEKRNARWMLDCVRKTGFERIVIVYPNNDPGSDGIAACWDEIRDEDRVILRRNLPRSLFLGLLRDSAVLVGNSSSGIIEAASFGTPVLDLGTRQQGREHGRNVIHIPMQTPALMRHLRRLWNRGKPVQLPAKNPYGAGGGTANRRRTVADQYRTLFAEVD